MFIFLMQIVLALFYLHGIITNISIFLIYFKSKNPEMKKYKGGY